MTQPLFCLFDLGLQPCPISCSVTCKYSQCPSASCCSHSGKMILRSFHKETHWLLKASFLTHALFLSSKHWFSLNHLKWDEKGIVERWVGKRAMDLLLFTCESNFAQKFFFPNVISWNSSSVSTHPSLGFRITPLLLEEHSQFGLCWFQAEASWATGPLVTASHHHCIYSIQPGPCLFLSLNFWFQRHYNDEDPEKEKRIKELELLLMSTENELKGQQALPVRTAPGAWMGGWQLYPLAPLCPPFSFRCDTIQDSI